MNLSYSIVLLLQTKNQTKTKNKKQKTKNKKQKQKQKQNKLLQQTFLHLHATQYWHNILNKCKFKVEHLFLIIATPKMD
jgi:hypothetical protein